jgi:serine/threonine-protein kinase
LWAVPFDPDKLETRGTAVPVLNDVAYASTGGSADYCVSGNGTLIYRRDGTGSASALGMLQWIDATGKKEPLRDKAGEYLDPRPSQNGIE